VVGGVSGGTEQASRLRAVRWEKPKGEKRLRPNHAVRSAEKRTLRPRTTTAMRTTAPRSRQGARPARQESAHGFNPKRRRACLCGGDPEEAGTSMAIAGRGSNDEGAKHDAL